MTDDALTLQQIAQRAVDRNGGSAGRSLDREAKRQGLTLSYTTVDKILAGTYRSTPKRVTLDALAVLAGLSKEQVYAAAGRPLPQAPFAEQLPPDVDLLTPTQRESVLSVIRQFVQSNLDLHEAVVSLEPRNEGLDWEDREQILELVETEQEPEYAEDGRPAFDVNYYDSPEYREDVAARKIGEASAGQKRRAQADQAGEPPADDPDDNEPR